MKKAYIARIEIELPILAENESEAAKIAEYHFDDEPVSRNDFEIIPLTYMPNGCDSETLMYSDGEEDVTIGSVRKTYVVTFEDSNGQSCNDHVKAWSRSEAVMRFKNKGYCNDVCSSIVEMP